MIELEDLPGVGPKSAEKLRENGYDDLMSIAAASAGDLAAVCDIGELTAQKIITAAREKLDMGFKTAADVLEMRKEIGKISTGSDSLDALLGGGVETQAITETHGAFGSGKCVSKDTMIPFFNDENLHFAPIEKIYNTYKKEEQAFDEGWAFPVTNIQVFGITKNGVEKVRSTILYKQKVRSLYRIKTKRGRELKVTGQHKLLTVNQNGMVWIPAALLLEDFIIAIPKKIKLTGHTKLDKDDAYFLGVFVAEGTSNPLSVTTSNEDIKSFIVEYINKKFGYIPKVRKRKGKTVPLIYTILLKKKTREILRDLADCNAKTKFVPEEVFVSDNEIVKEFLRGFIDGDGYIGKIVDLYTKSKRLCSQLLYLLKLLGIDATLKYRVTKNEKHYRIHIVGKDREKLNGFLKTEFKTRNSSYGYPKPICDFLRKSYKEVLGGDKGNQKKRLGKRSLKDKRVYRVLTRDLKDTMNEKTFEGVVKLFIEGRKDLEKAKNMIIRLNEVDEKKFNDILKLIPFSYRSIVGKTIGMRSSTLGNYTLRGLPFKRNKEAAEKVKKALLEEINARLEKLEHVLAVCKNIHNLSWDTIECIEKVEYNDFVYDFVVPDGHCFVGGQMPTLLHNSQIGFQLAVNVQKPKKDGGLNANCLFIDTEATFRPQRIAQIAESVGMDPKKALKKVYVGRAYNSDHQVVLVEKAKDIIREKNIKLLVVDSLTSAFRSDYTGRGELAARQQKLNRHLHALQKLADVYNIAIYVTNQVMARPDVLFGDPTIAIGGHVLGHAATFRLYLRKGKKGSRIARLIDSPSLPEGEAVFKISERGVHD